MESSTNISKHKAQVGRALKGVQVLGIYHSKHEILVLRTTYQPIRYFPFADFRLEFEGKIYNNATLHDLRRIAENGSIDCAD